MIFDLVSSTTLMPLRMLGLLPRPPHQRLLSLAASRVRPLMQMYGRMRSRLGVAVRRGARHRCVHARLLAAIVFRPCTLILVDTDAVASIPMCGHPAFQTQTVWCRPELRCVHLVVWQPYAADYTHCATDWNVMTVRQGNASVSANTGRDSQVSWTQVLRWGLSERSIIAAGYANTHSQHRKARRPQSS